MSDMNGPACSELHLSRDGVDVLLRASQRLSSSHAPATASPLSTRTVAYDSDGADTDHDMDTIELSKRRTNEEVTNPGSWRPPTGRLLLSSKSEQEGVCESQLARLSDSPRVMQPTSKATRKQALSFILNGGSQDQAAFDTVLATHRHEPRATTTSISSAGATTSVASTVTTTSGSKKRSYEMSIGGTEETQQTPERRRRKRRSSVPCDVCGRVFGEAAALRKHQRVVHEKLKDFECDQCGRKFAEKSNLKKHQQARHGAATKPHPCPDCNKVFNFSDGLRRHINNCHLGLRPYKCTVEGCQSAFKQRTHLQKHLQSVHGLTADKPT